ncbi:MAG: fibronectin type III domain-containing protein [Deltaproteobacteria bacterium]|nr:fibronectin type III domain-containing protein [Deltaproteobacteria bacterium]
MRTLPILFCAAALLAGCEDKTPPTWEGDGLLEATVEGTNVRLSWPAAADDGLKEHRILQDGDEIATVGGDVREHLIEDLDDATTYELTVEAIDEAGNRSEPLHATATTADETGPHWIAGAALRVEGEPPPEVAPGEAAPEVERAPAVLEWDRAEDVSGVAGYRVMAGQTELANVQGLRHELGRPLAAGERETLSVIATDDAGNESAPLRWRAEAAGEEAPLEVAQGELEVPEVQLAEPTGNMPAQAVPNVNLNPAQAAIIDRVRRMGGGIRRPQLERSALMLREPQAQ